MEEQAQFFSQQQGPCEAPPAGVQAPVPPCACKPRDSRTTLSLRIHRGGFRGGVVGWGPGRVWAHTWARVRLLSQFQVTHPASAQHAASQSSLLVVTTCLKSQPETPCLVAPDAWGQAVEPSSGVLAALAPASRAAARMWRMWGRGGGRLGPVLQAAQRHVHYARRGRRGMASMRAHGS